MIEWRAGGTDIQDRHRRRLPIGTPVDIPSRPDRIALEWNRDGGVTMGALVRIAAIAGDDRMRRSYAGLSAAAGDLATPQIRAVATIGGGLLQRTRCWYYRAGFSCFKSGGDGCPARAGDHRYGACFDLGPCVWPHPSTLGMALAAYDTHVMLQSGRTMTIAELYGDGGDPHCDHRLLDEDLLTCVRLAPPVAGERSSYVRISGRALAEWPYVEVVARAAVDNHGRVSFARVSLGGVANVPLRVDALERALLGAPLDRSTIETLAADALTKFAIIPDVRYKLAMIPVAIADALLNSPPASPRIDWALAPAPSVT
jgi:xanthine dehydrogenase YagS FAD-binding subunit